MYRRLGADKNVTIKPHVPCMRYKRRRVRNCSAIHYDSLGNKTYHIAPQPNYDRLINSPFYTGRFHSCEFTIPVLETRYLGRWDVITYFNDTVNSKDGLTKQIDTVEIHEMKFVSRKY